MNLQKKKKNFVVMYNKSKYKKFFKSKIIMTLSKSQTFLISNKNFTDFLNKYDISFAKKGKWINNIKGQSKKRGLNGRLAVAKNQK